MTILVFGFVVAFLAVPHRSQAAPGGDQLARARTIRIRNAGTIRVVLGKKREPAAGVRPDRDGWPLVVAADLDGSSAELQDVTPNAQGNKWTLAVAGGRLALDAQRFLPTHVYRVVFRRDRQVVGSALLYLYPPSTPRRSRVDFADGPNEKDSDDGSAPIAPTPKSGL